MKSKNTKKKTKRTRKNSSPQNTMEYSASHTDGKQPSFLASMELKSTIEQNDPRQNRKETSILAVGPQFYAIGKDETHLLIYDSETNEKKVQFLLDSQGHKITTTDIIIIKDIVYFFGSSRRFYSYKLDDPKGPRLLHKDLRGSGWYGRTLRAGFFGEGIVYNDADNALRILDLDGRGGIRRIINLNKLDVFENYDNDLMSDEINDHLIAGKYQNQIVSFYRSGFIVVRHYFLKRRKLLKTYVFQMQLYKDNSEKIFGADLCPSDPQYIAVYVIRWSGRKSSRVVILRLTEKQAIEEVASCDLYSYRLEEIRVIKFFSKGFKNDRFLMMISITFKASSNRAVVLCFDKLSGELKVVENLELVLQCNQIYKAERAFGGIYCVDYTGALIGLELAEKVDEYAVG